MTTREVETSRGAARVHCDPRAVLVLGHGAGGGVAAPDLTAAAGAARSSGVAVVLVEQPYRVAGRRSPPPAAHLDDAWMVVIDELRAGDFADLRCWSVAGRRARGWPAAPRRAPVPAACSASPSRFSRPRADPRPRRRPAVSPSSSRSPLPTLVVQGLRDPFGMPPAGVARTVVPVSGDHSLRSDLEEIAGAVRSWLTSLRLDPHSTETSMV